MVRLPLPYAGAKAAASLSAQEQVQALRHNSSGMEVVGKVVVVAVLEMVVGQVVVEIRNEASALVLVVAHRVAAVAVVACIMEVDVMVAVVVILLDAMTAAVAAQEHLCAKAGWETPALLSPQLHGRAGPLCALCSLALQP